TFQLPSQVVANAYLNVKISGAEEKFSKSRGNAIWVGEYLEEMEPDPLRYYLTAIAPESNRTAFEMTDFIQRNNSELLGALGNFVNRVVTFAQRYFDQAVPAAGNRSDRDRQHLARLSEAHTAVTELLETYRFKAALGEVMALARDANAYFNEKAPWAERKTDLAACGTTINLCLLTTRTLATLMAPFLPFSAARTARMLGLSEELPWADAVTELESGHAIGVPELLFRTYPPEGADTSEG
ncbi:MAG: class I tRNA ligase family protein, partial [Candidatus Eisenbacteria bacterium]|nr:class I tRNA ligase family protein [Candidatus Eisenbacteria bacterium]